MVCESDVNSNEHFGFKDELQNIRIVREFSDASLEKNQNYLPSSRDLTLQIIRIRYDAGQR